MTTRDQVLALLPADADGVLLESAGIVSWYLGGARTTVPLGGPSVVVVLVGRGGDQVRCHVMEADRLRAEEGVTDVVPLDWTEPLVPESWRLDHRIRSEESLESDLRAVRSSLTDTEVERYRALGADVAAAVTTVATALSPAHTERASAGGLADCLYSLGAEPVVILVAGSSRERYRHPLPTEASLGRRAMLVVSARRRGLIVNLTRWVQFSGRVPAAEADLRRVEADVLDATVPGTAIRDVFAALRASYGRRGFDPDEWRRHHQGGPTGYIGRDPKVTPESSGRVVERQAFSWNPSAAGIKTEDTVLAASRGMELLTHDPLWPAVEVAGRRRPLTLHL